MLKRLILLHLTTFYHVRFFAPVPIRQVTTKALCCPPALSLNPYFAATGISLAPVFSDIAKTRYAANVGFLNDFGFYYRIQIDSLKMGQV